MKLNNHGMSLMELLVSIILISAILMFLYELLIDLKNETDNNNFAYNNQINRMEVIKTIEADLDKYTLTSVEDNSTNDKITIIFHFNNNISSILTSDKEDYTNELGDDDTRYYFRYQQAKGTKNSWQMKGAEIDPCYTFTYYNDNNKYYFLINIKLYNNPFNEKNNVEDNNIIDDLEISFSSDSSNLDLNNFLTKSSNSNKKINSCTN